MQIRQRDRVAIEARQAELELGVPALIAVRTLAAVRIALGSRKETGKVRQDVGQATLKGGQDAVQFPARCVALKARLVRTRSS